MDNNVWLVGDDDEVVVVDPAHDAARDRCGPWTAAPCSPSSAPTVTTTTSGPRGEVADATGAPVLLHPDDGMLWDVVHPDRTPSQLADGDVLEVADAELRVLHTPGHSPGAVCLHVPGLGVVLTGDTLFRGGPGATGRSYSDFPTILASIRDRLLTLPPGTRVLTGHGEETTIGAEAADYDAWVARGH